MKRLLFVLLSIMTLLCVSYEASAYDINYCGLYYNVDGTNASVTYATASYNSYSGSVVIPSSFTYNGTTYNVTEIGENAFYSCTSLTKVTIPGTVKTLREFSFNGCTKLSSIILPASVDTLSKSCFNSCTSLTTVTLQGDSIKAYKNAFKNCNAIKTVNIKNINFLLHSYFYEDESNPIYYAKCFYINGVKQTSVVIPEGTKYIPQNAFSCCTAITSLSFPSSLTTISGFAGCTGLKEVSMPENVTEIGASAFGGCTGLKEVSIPKNVTEIGASAFNSCTGLSEIIIPENVTQIKESAFYGCTGLSSVIFPKNLESIGAYAFAWDSNLISVSFMNPNGVNVGKYAFEECKNISKVTFVNESALIKMSYDNFNATPLYYSKKAYIGENEVLDIKIPYGNYYIGKYALANCEDLRTVKIPSSVSSIEMDAFANCKSLKSIYLPKSVAYIGDGAFSELDALQYMNIPLKTNSSYSSSTSCDFYRFYHCGGTAYIDAMPTSTTDWRSNAWFVHSYFKEVIFGDSIKSICDDSFLYTHIKKATLSKNVEILRYNSFGGGVDTLICYALIPPTLYSPGLNTNSTIIYVPTEAYETYKADATWSAFTYIYPMTDSVIEFKDYETRDLCLHNFDYNGNGKLEASEIARVTSLGTIFQGKDIGCFDELKYFTGLTYIPANCFANCKYLESIEFPSTIKSVGNFAFYGCISLKDVVMNEGLTTIGNSAFENCGHMKQISLPSSLKLIENSAFNGCESINSLDSKSVLPPTAKINVFKGVATVDCKITVPSASENSYKSTYPWCLFWATSVSESEAMCENLPYDVNDDSIVNIVDVDMCSKMVTGEIDPHTYADVNKDGDINIVDVTDLVAKLNGNSTERVLSDKKVVLTLNGYSQPSITIPTELKSEITIFVSDDEYRIINDVSDAILDFYISGTSYKTIVYEGISECNIHLNGVNINTTYGTALNILCGKKINLIIEDGKTNTLCDGAIGDQKAALYTKGHLDISGTGVLNVTGNLAHAIKSKEYIKIADATINIKGAQGDAMHVGQYFEISSGKVNIDNNTVGDGIQIEFVYLDDDITLDPSKEYNGKIFIKGGIITETINGEDSKGIKADSDVEISGGYITINANGNGSRGIQTDGSMTISEANSTTNITITATGNRCTVAADKSDPHRCMGVKTDGNLTISGGTLTVSNTGKKSKGIKVGGTYFKTGGTVNATVE